jgi:indole-3-glycerol phosphate synthase
MEFAARSRRRECTSRVLDELVAGAVHDASERRLVRGLAEVESAAVSRQPAIDAVEMLRPSGRVKIIAEVKRASPSRGPLAEIPDPAALASRYELGGASAISVLTEGRRFGGSLADIESVRAAVSLPILRKDFIVEPYQIFEARAAGADIVLLIVAALDQATMTSLFELTSRLGMAALVEAHSVGEVSRAIDVGAQLIGVNARDLRNFELDRDLFGRLAEQIPDTVIRIAESAVKAAEDVAHYRAAGADVVLVGEALVTGDPVATLREFLAV